MKKKLLVAGISSLLAITVFAFGSFAFFSSSAKETTSGGQVGTLSANTNLIINTVNNKQNGQNLSNWNPGDINELDLSINNKGNKSLKTRSSIYILWDDNDFNNYSNHEKDILLYSSKIDNADINKDMLLGLGNETKNISSEDITDFSFKDNIYSGYKYVLPDVSLNGVGDSAEIDVSMEQNTKDFKSDELISSGEYTYKLAFSNYANVHTMNKKFKVVSVTEGLQYRNTNNSDWQTIDINEISIN